jgi:site-specific DNA recombinase
MARNVTVIPASQTTRKADDKKRKVRVAAYCRVSTAMEEQTNSYKNQVKYYTEYINRHPEYVLAGVYGDEGISGTSLKRREQFKRLIEDCEAGKIDMVITKSISRFARNTQDCLHYSRKLKSMGIPVFFEKENVSTTDSGGELLFTILSSLAQEEARNISENTTWGIRTKFKNGEGHMNGSIIMGYRHIGKGKMEIDEEQAKVVRRIYKMFLEGVSESKIARALRDDGIVGVKGKVAWSATSIRAIISNEKYIGDSLFQKTYTPDYLTHKNIKNTGQVDQYYVKGTHPAIIDGETWEAAQLELKRREKFINEHGLKYSGYAGCSSPYIAKVFCGACGKALKRHSWSSRGIVLWKCMDKGCRGKNIDEKVLDRSFVIAWNSIVDKRDDLVERWQQMVSEGNALERIRGQQMIDLTAEGKIVKQIPELTTMVMESMTVNKETVTVRFLDGTMKEIAN